MSAASVSPFDRFLSNLQAGLVERGQMQQAYADCLRLPLEKAARLSQTLVNCGDRLTHTEELSAHYSSVQRGLTLQIEDTNHLAKRHPEWTNGCDARKIELNKQLEKAQYQLVSKYAEREQLKTELMSAYTELTNYCSPRPDMESLCLAIDKIFIDSVYTEIN